MKYVKNWGRLGMNFNRYALGELVQIKYGKNQKKVVSDNGIIPIYGTGGLMGYATTPLYTGPSVLIGRKGTINKVKYVNHPFWTVDTLFYTIVNEDLIIPKYLYYIMSLLNLNSYNEGTTIPSLRTETLNRLEFNIPSIENQKKVLSYLEPLDDKIELNNAINKNLEQQAKTLYEKVISSNKCEKCNLIEILVLLKDGTHNPPKRINVGVPLITGQTLDNGFISYEKMTYISEADYQKIHKKYQPQANDIIITKIGTVGKVAILRECDIPITVHCNSAILRFNNSFVSQEWAYWMVQSSNFKKEFNIRIANTVQDFVSLGRMEDIPILLPSQGIVDEYSPIFKDYISKLSQLNFENQKLMTLR